MSIGATRDALSRVFYQRCFWLFLLLLILIGAVSFVPASDYGRLILNGVNMFLLIATVAAVGRTTLPFVIALLLAGPAVWFQYLGLWHDSDSQTGQFPGCSAPPSISSRPRICSATFSSQRS